MARLANQFFLATQSSATFFLLSNQPKSTLPPYSKLLTEDPDGLGEWLLMPSTVLAARANGILRCPEFRQVAQLKEDFSIALAFARAQQHALSS